MTIPILWAIVPTIIYLLILWWIDRYEKEPLLLLIFTLICGIVIPPAITVFIEKLLGLSSSIYPHYFTLIDRFNYLIPIIEEEKAVIKEQLAEELKNGVVLPDEYEALTHGGRFRREWDILCQKGIAPWYYLRKLFQLEVDPAFRKWHTVRGERLKGFQRVYSEESLRAQIAGLRAKLI